MKTLISIFSFVLSVSYCLGQQTSQVVGSLQSETGEPIAFASVLLFDQADSSIVKTAFSTENGEFLLTPLYKGKYNLSVRFSGFQSYQVSGITIVQGQKMDLGKITLKVLEANIETVQIQAKRPLIEVKPDKTVLNVAGTSISIGENALELLRKAPGIIIDNNNNILLMGKSGTRIYIDGKPSPLSASDLAVMLQGMQSDQIDAIEIIANPSAKYEAEGNAGIIDIRLKKDKNLGLNASVSLGYGIGRFSKYTGSTTMNYRNKALNIFGNYSGGVGNNFNFTRFLRIQNGIQIDQRTDGFDDYLNHNFKLGTDFFLGKKHTLGFMVNGFISQSDYESESISPIYEDESRELINRLEALSESISDRSNVNTNINYVFRGKKGTKLSVDGDYGRYRMDRSTFQPNQFIDPFTGDILAENTFGIDSPTDIDLYSAKADIDRKLLGGDFSAGIRLAFIETKNTFEYFDIVDGLRTLNPSRSNEFTYNEDIQAIYSTYGKQVKKWKWQIGLRAERTVTKGTLISEQVTGLDTVDRKYINLFPTAGLTYSPNRINMFRLNYSRRIDRPRYQSLNPFLNQMDQLSYSKGNPFLLPQYTHSIQLTHTYKYRFTTSLSYSLTNDYFTSITDTFNVNASFITQENLTNREVIGLSISTPLTVNKWWSLYSSINANRIKNTGNFNLPGETGKEIDITRNTFSIYQQHTFTLPKKLILEVSGFYNSPSIWGANYLSVEFWGINTGLQYKLLKNNLLVKVSVTDIFNSMQWGGIQRFGGLIYDASGGYESRQFKVNLTWQLGNSQVKASRKRKTGLQDEGKRAGSGGQSFN